MSEEKFRMVRATDKWCIINHWYKGDRQVIHEYALTPSSRKRIEKMFGWRLKGRKYTACSGIFRGRWE